MGNDPVKMTKLTYTPPKKAANHKTPEVKGKMADKNGREKKRPAQRPADQGQDVAAAKNIAADFLDRIAPAAGHFYLFGEMCIQIGCQCFN